MVVRCSLILAAITLTSCRDAPEDSAVEGVPPATPRPPGATITIAPADPTDMPPEIEAILEDPLISPSEKGIELLALAPALTDPNDRTEALDNALILLAPEEYGLALNLAAGPRATPEIQLAVLEDALLRERPLRLPALLRLASSPGIEETLRATARATLSAEIGQDYGTNWASWSDAIEAVLEGG